MKQSAREFLLTMMDEVATKLAETKGIVCGACDAVEAQSYEVRADMTLDEIARARAFVSAAVAEDDGDG